MKSATRLTKGKIVVERSELLAPTALPLGSWAAGRRRVPAQERSQRTRRVILDAAATCATSEGIGSITMQMIAARSKIAAGTAYQFYNDRDAIFAEIYEEWATAFWSTLMRYTTTPWSEANWRDELHRLVHGMSRFYYASASSWDIVVYVQATKQGRGAMKRLLDGNIDRYLVWAGPLFRSRGYSLAETRSICTLLVRTVRGHWVYGISSPVEMRELAKLAEEGMRAIVEVKLTRASRPRSVSGKSV